MSRHHHVGLHSFPQETGSVASDRRELGAGQRGFKDAQQTRLLPHHRSLRVREKMFVKFPC